MPLEMRATGPGRVNLIGDHTDYNQGLALPMAVDLGIDVAFTPSASGRIGVSSAAFGTGTQFPDHLDPDRSVIASVHPSWARLVAAMIAVSPPATGGDLAITGSLPTGAGLSSSAALAVALSEVWGDDRSVEDTARLAQRAEHLTGAPVGIMDPLVCAGGQAGHALWIDFASLSTRPVPIPPDVDVLVVDSGQRREVRSTAYADRVAECSAASKVIGPLGLADAADLATLDDPVLRHRARHVVSECGRVRQMVQALETADLVQAGRVLAESHTSLALDFEVSTPALDDLVAHLVSIPGVVGARMTGAGFGGCVVALARPGSIDPATLGMPAWRVTASDGTVARRVGRPGDPTRR